MVTHLILILIKVNSRVEGLAHVLPVPEDSVHSGAPGDVAGEAGRPARQEGHLPRLDITTGAGAACRVWRETLLKAVFYILCLVCCHPAI